MKKKLMMVAVLLGALTLGACVEDGESSSVEAIRNAQAQKLTSFANLKKAEADAATKLAAANAAMDAAKKEAAEVEAQAAAVAKERAQVAVELENTRLELKKAQADNSQKQQALQLEQQLIELERQEASLALSAAQLEEAQKNLKDQIEKDKAQLELDLINSQKELEEQAAALQGYLETAHQADVQRYNNLIFDYTNSVFSLNEQKKSLSDANYTLWGLQNNLVTAEEAYAELKKDNEIEIAFNKEQITYYTELKNTSFADLVAKKDAARVEYLALIPPYQVAINAYSSYNYNVQRDAFNNSEYRTIVNSHLSDRIPIDGIWTSVVVAESNGQDYLEYSLGNATYSSYYDIVASAVVNKDAWTLLIAEREDNVAYWKTLVDDYTTQYNTYVEATKAAKKAWDEAAEADKAAKEQAYQRALEAERGYKTSILDNSTENYKNVKSDLDELKADYAYLTAQANIDAYAKVLADYNGAMKKEAELWIDYWKADYMYRSARNYYLTLNNLCTSNTDNDSATLIAELEKENEELQAEIDEAAGVKTAEEAIAVQKKKIAHIESLIPTLEKIVAQTKAALEAAVNE